MSPSEAWNSIKELKLELAYLSKMNLNRFGYFKVRAYIYYSHVTSLSDYKQNANNLEYISSF